MSKCSECGGKGWYESEVPDGTGDMFCHNCDGSGEVKAQSKRLTPRVGDRVLIPGKPNSVVKLTQCGWVRGNAFGDNKWYLEPDDGTSMGGSQWFAWNETEFEILDRDPVEWPEGWRRYRQWAEVVTDITRDPIFLRRIDLDRIRGPEGDYVAEHWDELMGGDS